MFGQAGNSSFGFNATPTAPANPFGQSAFGKSNPAPTFGTNTAPVFGSNTSLFNQKPASATTGGLFGSTTTTPNFGTSTSTQSTFGGFGSANTTAPLFGSQQNASTNLFGTTTAAPAFGQAQKTTSFGFGQTQSTGLFGQTQQTAQATPFGQTAAAPTTGLFGANTSFGAASTNTMSNMTGTVVKFNPVTGSDSMVKNGTTQTISTRHHCITCMKEYENKSLEELRLEDYAAGRKGGGQGMQPGSMFGGTAQTSPFGAAVSTASTGFGGMSNAFSSTAQQNNTSLFSKPMTSFGAPAATTSSTFAFNPTTSSSLFNTQAKPFGTAAGTSLFGDNNQAATTTNAFGAIGTQNTAFPSFSNTQQNQSIGLFSQNKPAFNTPATSTTSFGFGQTSTANTSGGLFAKPLGTTGFGTTGFGTTNNNFQVGNTGFGTNQNNSSLFNNSFKAAGQTTGFSFGNTSAAPTTGLGATSAPLFNATTKPSLFSNTGGLSSFSTPGLGTLGSFGSNTNAAPIANSNLFGNSVTNANVQSATGTVPVHQRILALVSTPFGDSPLLKNLLPASGKSERFLTQPPANTSTPPKPGSLAAYYKINTGNNENKPKLKVVTSTASTKKQFFEGLEEEDPMLEAFQPRPNSKRLILRPKPQNFDDAANNSNNANKLTTTDNEPCNLSLTDAAISPALDKENDMQDNPASGRRLSTSWLKSLPRKSFVPDDQIQEASFSVTCESPRNTGELENTVTELRAPTSSKSDADVLNDSNRSDKQLDVLKDKSVLELTRDDSRALSDLEEATMSHQLDTPNKAKVKLQRYGYYTIPALDQLYKYVSGETCIVPNFTIGRKGYGNVYFADSFDVYGLNLDEIVHFRHKEVIIYPDDEVKPPVGQGLNRKAQVTLERVWPHDKSTHEPITDPQRLQDMDYEGRLRRVSAKHDTRFLEYRPETGSWVFKVDHFSKYGLSDSDDEDADPKAVSKANLINKLKQPLAQHQQQHQQQKPYEVGKNLSDQYSVQDMQFAQSVEHLTSLGNKFMTTYNLQSNDSTNKMEESNNLTYCSPSTINACLAGTEPHTLQLMKASFFDMADDFIEDALYESKQQISQNFRTKLSSAIDVQPSDQRESNLHSFIESKKIAQLKSKVMPGNDKVPLLTPKIKVSKALVNPTLQPKVAMMKFRSAAKLFNSSIVSNYDYKRMIEGYIPRMKIARSSWGPQSNLLTAASTKYLQMGSNIPMKNAVFMNEVQMTNAICGDSVELDQLQIFKVSIEDHLKIHLKYSTIEDHPICPISKGMNYESSLEALKDHKNSSLKIINELPENFLLQYSSNIWRLCETLWGRIEDSKTLEDETSHEMIIQRKEALGEWLKLVSADTVKKEIALIESSEEIVYSLLSTCNLEKACNKAMSVGDHCLALLISQMGGADTVGKLLKQQINLWQQTECDKNISTYRLRLFMLMAGIPTLTVDDQSISVCDNLDWKRAFAIHLWFLSSPTASITDVLTLFEESFSDSAMNNYSASPLPDYQKDFETSNGKVIYDLCFHLLKLYSSRNYPLEPLVNPQTFTQDPLDYRLTWLLQQVLMAIGYTHLSEHVVVQTHSNFAAQLEAYDLWHWSIFVNMHVKDPHKRFKIIFDLLLRHVQLNADADYTKREEFLLENLKIPAEWINKAKAIKASSMKRWGEAAYYYIKAQDWNEAHVIIMQHLATIAIINEDHVYLRSLLNLLTPSHCHNTISGWTYQGQLLWDYLTVTDEIKNLLNSQDHSDIAYKLEKLRPKISSFCTKICNFPCPTLKHTLCQAEMAKRTLQLVRGLIILQSDNRNSDSLLVDLISQLPLPEDYVQQELRPIVNICINDIVLH
ncbi:unnamed protein product [Trichogramma brassicae]|uniref:Nuclear pore complex protein Nup98-Nup96 n=1 Tax=Trichogramma brassicae TaxID=86971 RepID=A0A6H5I756_9HYME|nr:unnamed protein product [Trichogramma brassicae]